MNRDATVEVVRFVRSMAGSAGTHGFEKIMASTPHADLWGRLDIVQAFSYANFALTRAEELGWYPATFEKSDWWLSGPSLTIPRQAVQDEAPKAKKERFEEIMGHCLCGLKATVTVPMWRGMSLAVCARCKDDAAALGASRPSPALVLNSVEMLLDYCCEQDAATGHDQGPNFALGHMATIAAYFGVESKVSAEYPNQAARIADDAAGEVIAPLTPRPSPADRQEEQ